MCYLILRQCTEFMRTKLESKKLWRNQEQIWPDHPHWRLSKGLHTSLRGKNIIPENYITRIKTIYVLLASVYDGMNIIKTFSDTFVRGQTIQGDLGTTMGLFWINLIREIHRWTPRLCQRWHSCMIQRKHQRGSTCLWTLLYL